MKKMVIGLTGGIGTGKSTVTDYLRGKGYPVVDADAVSRKVVEPGSVLLDAIKQKFGNDVMLSDGNLNRKALGDLVFNDSKNKKALDSIMMDSICNEIKYQVETLSSEPKYSIIFVDAALLFEAGLDKNVDRIWLVDADEQVRIGRVMRRDGFNEEEVSRRISSQMSREELIAKSDIILDNSGDMKNLYLQVDRLLEEYGIR